MPEMRLGGLRLEKGIDSVTYVGREDASSHLPDGYLLPSPGDNVRPHIAELLDAPDTAQYLNAHLQPSVANRELLAPAKFRAILNDAQESLVMAAGQGVNTRVLNRAIRLLNEDKGLRELIQTYRSALYQG